MTKTGILLRGLTLGAIGGYFFDPERGRRRRALLRDQALHQARRLRHGVEQACRDLEHRAQGLLAEGQAVLSHEDVSDDVLVERVRSKIGRYVSHPRAIEIDVSDGRVQLAGRVPSEEVLPLVRAVACVRGVRDVHNRLDAVDDVESVPELQGTPRRAGGNPDTMQADWTPATRLLVGGGGTLLCLNGLLRSGLTAKLGGAIGLGMVLRAATNMDCQSLLGMGSDPRGIDLHKSIEIKAAPEQVFELLATSENLPRFMRNVRDVSEQDGRVQGTIIGPAGMQVHFEELVEREPNRRIRWKSAPSMLVPYSGSAELLPTERGTRVEVRMTYNPPAGMLGHTAAALIGADPKSFVDDLLMRAKTTLETGNPPRDAAETSYPTTAQSSVAAGD